MTTVALVLAVVATAVVLASLPGPTPSDRGGYPVAPGAEGCVVTGTLWLQGTPGTVQGLGLAVFHDEGDGGARLESRARVTPLADGAFWVALPGAGAFALSAAAPGYSRDFRWLEAPRDCGQAVELQLFELGPSNQVLAELGRSGCAGSCPAYVVQVSIGGRVEWEGHDFVETEGRAVGHLSAVQVAELREAFATARFFELPDPAGCDVADTSAVALHYRDGDRDRTLVHAPGCPDEHADALLRLEARFEELVGTRRWIGPERPPERRSDRSSEALTPPLGPRPPR